MATFPGGGTTQKFRFIDQCERRYSIRALCRQMGVSASGFYAWKLREPSARAQQDGQLLASIRAIFDQHQGRYGSPKIHQVLRRQGIFIARKRVARLMRDAGLKARVERVYRRMHKRRAELKVLPNYRLGLSAPSGPNQQWSSDVTYIRLGKRHVFLAVVVDLWSRRIIGWSLQDALNASLSTAALVMAIKRRKPKPGLILHTDRGCEFRAKLMQGWLSRYGIRHSMNRPGQCTDNAEVESFFKTLKSELIYDNFFGNISRLRDKVDHYIRHFYNRIRLHSSLNYLSPIEYEKAA